MMKKKSLSPLGETEMEVLHHVWTMGRATVSEVQELVLKKRKVAYTTIMTVLNKLAKKGYLDRDTSGSSYIYSAARPPDEVRHNLLSGLMDKVFLGSPTALVQTLVKFESLTDDDLAEIRRSIDDLENKDANSA